MDSPIPDIMEEIRRQLSPLEQEIAQISQTLDRLTTRKDALHRALSELRKGDVVRPAAPLKAAVSKEELAVMMTECLQQRGPLKRSALEEHLRDRLSGDGQRSLLRFSQRFQAALDHSHIIITEDNIVSLVSDAVVSK